MVWKKKISFYSNSGKEHEPTSQGMKHMLMVCVNGAFEQAANPNQRVLTSVLVRMPIHECTKKREAAGEQPLSENPNDKFTS